MSAIEKRDEAQVSRFASSRIQEILALQSAIQNSKRGQHVSQQVGRRLRRRAVSHNPNRLPRRLRNKLLDDRNKEEASSNKADSLRRLIKRPSRKYRRRPSNLLKEYTRRQLRSSVWLETHLWHAKRFAMAQKWGYKLAMKPNDKAFRAAFRDVNSNGAILQDVSFMGCIELEGSDSMLSELLNHITPSYFQAELQRGKSGSFEVDSLIIDSYEDEAKIKSEVVVGKASFLWKPKKNEEKSEARRVWLWTHPSTFEHIKQSIIKVCKAVLIATNENSDEGDTRTDEQDDLVAEDHNDDGIVPKDKVVAAKLRSKPFPSTKIPKYVSSDSSIVIRILKDGLNRFRLCGPQTPQVLNSVLVKTSILEEEMSPIISNLSKEGFEKQWQLWQDQLRYVKPRDVEPKGVVMPLLVRDPRMLLPIKKRVAPECDGYLDAMDRVEDSSLLEKVALCERSSPLWSNSYRDTVTSTRAADAEINSRRSKNLIPGTQLLLSDEESRIAVILIHRQGDQKTSFGSGYDIILPSGWAMSFWMCMVYNGARAVGQEEVDHMALEQGRLQEPFDLPCTQAFRDEEEADCQEAQTDYFKHPPDKRCNFRKLGIAAPFDYPWSKLMDDYSDVMVDKGESNVLKEDKRDHRIHVVHDRKHLQQLQLLIQQASVASNADPKENAWSALSNIARRSLVPVQLLIKDKGVITSHSVICSPSSNEGDKESLLEPMTKDSKEDERRQLRQSHERRKRYLRKQWKSVKAKLQEMTAVAASQCRSVEAEKRSELESKLDHFKSLREAENEHHDKRLKELWLPSPSSSLRHSCSKELLGFILKGGYSYRRGKGFGLGFVPLRALLHLIDKRRLKCLKDGSIEVLVRENHSLQYRRALLSIAM